MQRGTLFAAPFDLQRLELTGRGVPVVPEVMANTVTGGAHYSVSKDGTLAYIAGLGIGLAMPLSLMEEAGKTTDVLATPFEWQTPRFSPKGERIALVVAANGVNDVHVYDTARQRLDKITYEAGSKTSPVWTPDGQRIVYTRIDPGGAGNLYWRRADGIGDVQQLTTGNTLPTAFSFDPTGKFLAYTTREGANPSDIMILPLEGDEATGWKPGTPRPFLKTDETESYPMFSPDGRWIAYMATAGGRPELYVRPFDGTGGPWQITSGGGLFPTWSRLRSEILYAPSNTTDVLMAVSYAIEGASFRPGNPRRWLPVPIRPQGASRTFDIHPDGKRVVAAPAPAGSEADKREVVLMFNFFDRLRTLVGPGRPTGR
jgi:serine/threonine-protein kinase